MHQYYFIIVVIGHTSECSLKWFSKTLLTLINNMKKWCSHQFKHIASCIGTYTYVYVLQIHGFIYKTHSLQYTESLPYGLINKHLSCVLLMRSKYWDNQYLHGQLHICCTIRPENQMSGSEFWPRKRKLMHAFNNTQLLWVFIHNNEGCDYLYWI